MTTLILILCSGPATSKVLAPSMRRSCMANDRKRKMQGHYSILSVTLKDVKKCYPSIHQLRELLEVKANQAMESLSFYIMEYEAKHGRKGKWR